MNSARADSWPHPLAPVTTSGRLEFVWVLRAQAETFPLECIASLPSCWEVEVGDRGLGGLGPRRRARGPFRVSLARGWGQGPEGAHTMAGGWRV